MERQMLLFKIFAHRYCRPLWTSSFRLLSILAPLLVRTSPHPYPSSEDHDCQIRCVQFKCTEASTSLLSFPSYPHINCAKSRCIELRPLLVFKNVHDTQELKLRFLMWLRGFLHSRVLICLNRSTQPVYTYLESAWTSWSSSILVLYCWPCLCNLKIL